MTLSGPSTRFPCGAVSKTQTSVSNSTPDAELVAAACVMMQIGIPVLLAWDDIFEKPIMLKFEEDNQAAIQAIQAGRSSKLRYLKRTRNYP